MRKVYVAGPMTGYEDFNFPAFHRASEYLRTLDYEVVNPAELDDGDTSRSWEYYMRRDIELLVGCDGIAVLDDWRESRGARIEVFVAHSLGLGIIEAMDPRVRIDDPGVEAADVVSDLAQIIVAPHEAPPPPADETILDEAGRLVGGPRGEDYGHPIEDFSRTGRMWAAILGVDEVSPQQVALCMTALKLSRECNRPKRDNRVDASGYMLCLDMIESRLAHEAA